MEPFGHRPLSAIVATAAGGVPQARIRRVIAEVLAPLMELHDKGGLHGAISTHTVGLDERGCAHLLVPALYPSNAAAFDQGSCFGAPEQFVGSRYEERGPWTDIYALSAVAHSLMTGASPPHAQSRLVHDSYEPLAGHAMRSYDEDFRAAIDRGLALAPADRPRSLAEFAALLGLPAAVPESASGAAVAAGADAPMGAPAPRAAMTAGRARVRRLSRGLALTLGLGAAAVGIGTAVIELGRSPAVHGEARPAARSAATSGGAATTAATPPGMAANPPMPGQNPAAGKISPTPPVATGSAPESGAGSTDLRTAAQLAPAPASPAAAAAAAAATAAAAAATATATTTAAAATATAKSDTETPAAAAPPAIATPLLVRIDVRPWGEVFIDGTSRGITPPLKQLYLPPGKYRVVVRNADLPPYRATLEIKPGRTAVIAHLFE
jgi:hypothetical protein